MFFVWNELKDLLQIKELAVFGFKNELYFERQKRKTNSKIRPKTGSATSPRGILASRILPCLHVEVSRSSKLLDFRLSTSRLPVMQRKRTFSTEKCPIRAPK
jgi:hypothetical protein